MKSYQKESMLYNAVNEFAKTIEMFNLSTADARLFAFLYLRKTPLTLDEMSDAFGKSKTSISTSARSLVDANLATLVWRKGERKDLYQANPNLYKSFMNASVTRWINFTCQQRKSLEKLRETLQEEDHTNRSLEMTLNDIVQFHQNIEETFQKMTNEEE